jgi:hypothetical protein
VEDYIVVIPSSVQGFAGNTINGNNVDLGAGISIYPNPVKGSMLTVDVLGSTPTNYVMYTITGQVVGTGDYTNQLDVSVLSAGVYILQINTDKGKFIERFVKQ